jgi:hypothetical protein
MVTAIDGPAVPDRKGRVGDAAAQPFGTVVCGGVVGVRKGDEQLLTPDPRQRSPAQFCAQAPA